MACLTPRAEDSNEPAPREAWQVYLVLCADGTLYCGCTTDIARRVRQHNGLLAGGARYTASRRPVTLVAARPCASRAEAQSLEARIKKLRAKDKARALFQPGQTTHA